MLIIREFLVKRLIIVVLALSVLVLPASAVNCFRPGHFQALKRTITELYKAQFPIKSLVVDELSSGQTQLKLVRRGGREFPNANYTHSVTGSFESGQFSDPQYFIHSAFRSGSDVSGGWGQFLVFEELVQEIRQIESGMGATFDPGIERYMPDKITAENVINAYLKPIMAEHIEEFATVNDGVMSVDIMPDDPLYKTLTDYMPRSEADRLNLDSTGHLGTQFVRFTELVSYGNDDVFNISKIRILNSPFYPGEINMEFHFINDG